MNDTNWMKIDRFIDVWVSRLRMELNQIALTSMKEKKWCACMSVTLFSCCNCCCCCCRCYFCFVSSQRSTVRVLCVSSISVCKGDFVCMRVCVLLFMFVYLVLLRLQHFTQLFHVDTLEGHGYILVWSKRSVYIKPFEGLDHLFSHRGTQSKYCARRAQIYPTPSVCCLFFLNIFLIELFQFFYSFSFAFISRSRFIWFF